MKANAQNSISKVPLPPHMQVVKIFQCSRKFIECLYTNSVWQPICDKTLDGQNTLKFYYCFTRFEGFLDRIEAKTRSVIFFFL